MTIFAWNCPIQSSSILSLDCPILFTPDFACTSFAQEANLLRPKVPFWQGFNGDESAGGLGIRGGTNRDEQLYYTHI